MEYQPAWELQKRLHAQVADGALPNILLLLEHPHVYTLGRRGKQSDILVSLEKLREIGAEVHHIDRGGEVTYHGPGQLVGYPIVNLRELGTGPLKYVQTLEKALIATLADLGIHSESVDRPTGVWVGDAKIAAIGVRISRGVTMHGFALNVNPDLSYFDHIVPCGLPGSAVASISRELSRSVSVPEIVPLVERRFGEAFGWETKPSTLDELERQAVSGVAD
ncbi:MAG: lipoyl(octanoyl) transferase LipB [Chloroflexi bacterium]|nr:lipoyl(octanoyl) transferase LipB [Chloroflexota bacterium]